MAKRSIGPLITTGRHKGIGLLFCKGKRYSDKQEEANAGLRNRTAHEKGDKAYEQSMELLLLPCSV